jgi:voltage-gated potassium channel
MYIIVDGEVALKLKHQHIRLVGGQFFGEVAVLRRVKRSATATAVVATRLLVLDASDLHGLMERQPALADRIKQAASTKLGHEIYADDTDLSANEYSGAPSQ